MKLPQAACVLLSVILQRRHLFVQKNVLQHHGGVKNRHLTFIHPLVIAYFIVIFKMSNLCVRVLKLAISVCFSNSYTFGGMGLLSLFIHQFLCSCDCHFIFEGQCTVNRHSS